MFEDLFKTTNSKLAGVIVIALLILLPTYQILKSDDESDPRENWPTGLWCDGDGNTRILGEDESTSYHGKVKDVTPEVLLAGQVNTLFLDSSGPVVLGVPTQGMIAIAEGDTYRIQNSSLLPLEGGATFHLLIAPTANNVSLIFYGHGIFNISLQVIPGSDPLISGRDVFELMEVITDDADG